MHNELLHIGKFTIYGYGLMIAIGFITAFLVVNLIAKQHNLDKNKVSDMFILSIITGIVGARLLYCFTIGEEFWDAPFEILLNGGLVVYGGVLCAIFANFIYCKVVQIDFLDYANKIIPVVPLAQAIGRIGCLFAGCCYGKETASHFAITFQASEFAPNNVPLLPTQIMSSFGDALIFMVLYYNLQKGKHKDWNLGLYFVLYGIGRFIIEFFRGDIERGFVGDLSTSQFISVFVIFMGINYLSLAKKGLLRKQRIEKDNKKEAIDKEKKEKLKSMITKNEKKK